ncbi:hypothetical protein ABZ442_08700 [Streptomyces triculaminicus]
MTWRDARRNVVVGLGPGAVGAARGEKLPERGKGPVVLVSEDDAATF